VNGYDGQMGRSSWVCAVVAVLLVVLTLLVGIGAGPLVELDHEVARDAYDATSGHAVRIDFWETVTTWGGPQPMRIVMLAGAVALALSRRWSLAGWLVALVLLEGAVAPAAKLVLGRARPHWTTPITTAGSSSYPSGHAAAAVTAAVAGLLLARRLGRGGLVRTAVPAVALAAAGAVAASRVFLGVHYLSDVVGGALLGTALALASYAALEWLTPDRTLNRSPG
jgi:membrane-associated phospholipid phosphatase